MIINSKPLGFLKKTDYLYISVLVLLLVYRYLVLVLFNYRFTDGDQTVMWQAVLDYSRGVFHEPRFYGQDYNAMIEALFAVPLYWLGIPVYKALPMVTNLMAIFPYILISLIANKNGKKIQSYVILSLSLFLSPEYDLVTSIPRGFVTGIFFASVGSIAIFYPDKKRGYLFLGFFGVIGYSMNPNSILITVPAMFYLFSIRYRNLKFYLLTGIGLVSGGVIHFLANYFYTVHPGYIAHKVGPPIFSFHMLNSSFSNLDEHFNQVTPFFWKMGWLALLLFILLAGIFFYRKQYREAFVMIFSPMFIIMTLGLDRMYTATDSVFFSYSRMYLAIPILLAFFIPFAQYRTNWFRYYFLVLVAGFFLQKSIILKETIYKATMYPLNHVVNISTITDLQRECRKRQLWINRFEINLVVDAWSRFFTLSTYGCPVCEPGFPKTLFPSYERRTWRLIEDQQTVYKNILIVDESYRAESILAKAKEMNIYMVRYGNYLFIRNNTIPTILLLKSLSLDVRAF